MVEVPEPVEELNWSPERVERLGSDVVDMWVEFIKQLPELLIDRGFDESGVRKAVLVDVPEEPLEYDELLAYMRKVVFDQSMYPGHPGFMAYISGSGTLPGAAADMLAAAINQNVGGWRLGPAATEIELALTRWLAARFGFPDTGGGIVLSGGALANFVCLKAARDAQAGYEVREKGVRELPLMTIYTSEEGHVVLTRAADMLGLGSDAVRKIETDDGFSMRSDLLVQAIEQDLAAGLRPIVVAGTAGTTATGSIDPLEELAAISKRFGMWFHIDAAYGGPAVLSDELRPLLAGIEHADSIAVDPHKWLYTPHSGGCAIVRDMSVLARSFGAGAAYIHEDKELTGRGMDLGQMGPQFSRGFHAFKVWISLLAHGTRAYGERIAHDVHLTKYLAARVEEHPELELVAPVTLSVACFRYVPPDVPDGTEREEYLDLLNERLMPAVQMDGRIYYSNAVIHGRFVQRICIVNFRTEAPDLDAVVDRTVAIGRELHERMRLEWNG